MGRLADAITGAHAERGIPCGLGQLMLTLNGDDLAEIKTYIADKAIAGTEVAAGINAVYDADIPSDVVARHRRGECRWCARRGLN